MAASKKTTSTTQAAPNTPKTALVREYKKAHPEATTEEIVKVLEKQGVTQANVWQALRNGQTTNKVSIEQIKAAAALIKSAGGVTKAMAQLEAANEAMALLKTCKTMEAAEAAIKQAEELRTALA